MAKLSIQEMIAQANEKKAREDAKHKAFDAYMRGPRTPLQRFRDKAKLFFILLAIVAILIFCGAWAFWVAVTLIRWIIWGGR